MSPARGNPDHRPRAHPIEAPIIWTAHLLAWVMGQQQRLKPPNTTPQPPDEGGFFVSEED